MAAMVAMATGMPSTATPVASRIATRSMFSCDAAKRSSLSVSLMPRTVPEGRMFPDSPLSHTNGLARNEEQRGGGVRRTTVGIIMAVAGQVMSGVAVFMDFAVAPAQVCGTPATVNVWLVTAAMGPLLVLVGVWMDG